MLKILDLFSGVGGFSLSAEMVGGFETVAFCEKNPFCRKVLKKHWPNIPIIEDICDVTTESLQRLGVTKIDIVCGGIPCQPFSGAGKRKGAADKRNLFPEFFRVLRDIQCRWAVIENVPGLLTANNKQFFRDILWQFSQTGMSVEWNCISAASVGAVHKRERIWIIAYPSNSNSPGTGMEELGTRGQRWQHADSSEPTLVRQSNREVITERTDPSSSLSTNPNSIRCNNGINPQREHKDLLHGQWDSEKNQQPRGKCIRGAESLRPTTTDPESSRRATSGGAIAQKGADEALVSSSDATTTNRKNEAFSRIYRGDDGLPRGLVSDRRGDYLMRHADLPEWLPLATDTVTVPYRKERLESLGNSLVPQVACIVWRRVKELAEQQEAIAQ